MRLSTSGRRNTEVFLTLLAGGAFGNDVGRIYAAMRRTLELLASFNIDIRIVTDGPPAKEILEIAEEFQWSSNRSLRITFPLAPTGLPRAGATGAWKQREHQERITAMLKLTKRLIDAAEILVVEDLAWNDELPGFPPRPAERSQGVDRPVPSRVKARRSVGDQARQQTSPTSGGMGSSSPGESKRKTLPQNDPNFLGQSTYILDAKFIRHLGNSVLFADATHLVPLHSRVDRRAPMP